MLNTTKRITLATVKSFVRKNRDKLHINVRSSFDGMVDCCMPCEGGFVPARDTDRHSGNTLGIDGAWFVRGSRDYFESYEDNEFEGITVYNSCGKFVLATQKGAA